MKNCLTLLLGFLISFPSIGQSDEGKKIVLQNEIKLYPFILDDQVQTPESFISEPIPQSEIVDGYYFRLIQFTKNLSAGDWGKLSLYGINNEAYIPYRSWILAIPVAFDRRNLIQFNPVSVVRLSEKNKINKEVALRLLDGTNPDASIEIQLQTYVSPNRELMEAELRRWAEISFHGTHKSTYDLTLKATLISRLAVLPFVKFIELSPGVPVPEDTRGRSLHRSNSINSDHFSGLKYNGEGVAISLADDGRIGPHIDLKGRIKDFNTTNTGTHGDMTTGIAAGAGNLDPRYRGMADGVFMNVFSINGYPQINGAVANFNNLGSVITSTSYSQGCNQYTTDSQDGDNKLVTNSMFNFVFSAGNNGPGNCNYGAGAGWGNITGGYKNGKNVIAVGNVNQFGIIESTSSRGPAPDGRIKPDICANGYGQFSTDQNYTYSEGGGTSAACPGIAGILAQLYQVWREQRQEANPDGGMMKAILLNSADDQGKTGPDFIYGWGNVNVRRAYQTIVADRIANGTVSDGDSVVIPISIPTGQLQAKIMLYWTDPAGQPNATVTLVNNLDLKVKTSAGQQFLPWILDPSPSVASLNAPATKGIDDLNNVEQVAIDNPEAGDYFLVVKGKDIPQGPQKFFIVYDLIGSEITLTYPNGGEGFVPGESESVRWDAHGNTTNFTLTYSVDSGNTWQNIGTTNATMRFLNWTVPNIVSGNVLVNVARGNEADVSDAPFSIVRFPTGLQVVKACEDSLTFKWNAVSGATAYEVSRLGEKYMDSVAVTSETNIKIPYNVNDTTWISVRAAFPGGQKGRRAPAIRKNPGLIGCQASLDLALRQIISPNPGSGYPCGPLTNYPVSILIKNIGINPVSNFPVRYKLGNNPVVSATFTDEINPGDSAVYTFSTGLNLVANTVYNMYIITRPQADVVTSNDSVYFSFRAPSTPGATFNQSFQVAGFPPIGWNNRNLDNVRTWTRSLNITGPQGVLTYAALMDNYGYTSIGQIDGLLSPMVDLTSANNPGIIFDVAYAPHTSRQDTLSVFYSKDCGVTYIPTLYRKGGAQLATVTPRSTRFTPTNTIQWRSDTISIPNAAGEKVIIMFQNKTGNGNSLYLDNIRTASGIVSNSKAIHTSAGFKIYPNPAQKSLFISMNSAETTGLKTVKVLGLDGRVVMQVEVANLQDDIFELNVQSLSSGMYLLFGENQNGLIFREKFFIQ